ncbi:MAG: putative RND superfamily exporter protein, partial [Limisphaerales bacterium]
MQTNKHNNTRVTALAEWVIKRRWFVVLASLVLTMMAGYGGQFITFNNDYHIFFDEGNPRVMAFDGLQEKYTKDDNVFIVIEPENGNVFTLETLKAIEDLEQRAWQTPFSTRVDALSNFQHTRAEGDDMYVESLASDMANKSEADLAQIKNIAMNEPLLVDRLINKDASVTAVNVTVNLPGDSLEATMDVIAHTRKMIEEWKADYPGHKTYLSGIIMLNGSFGESSMADMSSLVPLMFLVILLVVFITTRSFGAMVTSLFVLFFSIMSAMGIAGWFGVQLAGPSASAPTMI